MSDKRRHPRRKPLSEAEKLRRIQLHDERVRRRKKEKRMFWVKGIMIAVCAVILLFGGFLLGVLTGTRVMMIYYAVLVMTAALLTDRSGLRAAGFSKYPKRFPFADRLKAHDPNRAFPMELARTVCYFAMCLIVLWEKYAAVWSAAVIVSIVIGYCYIVTDRHDQYTFDKFSSYSDTAMFLIAAGLFGMELGEAKQIPASVITASLPEIALGAAVVAVLYGCLAEHKKKTELVFEAALFSALDILAAVILLQCYIL